jgi:hypothetical protein
MALFSAAPPMRTEPRYGPLVRAEPAVGPVGSVHIGAPPGHQDDQAGLAGYKLTRLRPRTPGEWLIVEDLPPHIARRPAKALLGLAVIGLSAVLVTTLLRFGWGVGVVPAAAVGGVLIALAAFVLPYLAAVGATRSMLRVIEDPDGQVLELCEAYAQCVAEGRPTEAAAIHERLWAVGQPHGGAVA